MRLWAPIPECGNGFTSVAVSARSNGCRPGRNGAEQGGCSGHERQNDCTAAGTNNVLLCASSHFIQATLGIGGSRSGIGRDEFSQVTAIYGIHSAVARRGEKDARCLCPVVTQVAPGPPLAAPKQMIEFIGNETFSRNRSCRICGSRGISGVRNNSGRLTAARIPKESCDAPNDDAVHSVSEFRKLGRFGSSLHATGDVTAKSIRSERYQHQVEPRQ